MAVTFELWNTRTGNLMGTFDSQAAALVAVSGLIARHGAAFADRLALGCEDRDGRSRQIACGEDLVRLAQSGGQHAASA